MHECELEMPLVGRALQPCAVGQHNLCILITLLVAVYHHAVEHAGARVLVVHIQVVSGNVTVEDALWNLQLGRLLLHAPHQGSQLLGGLRPHLVLEIEAACAHAERKDEHGLQDAHQGHAACLHGQELQALAHIAERDKACQQDRHGKRHGHQRETAVIEELHQHVHREAASHELFQITPHELHHEDEEANEECTCKEQEVVLQYEYIELLEYPHYCVCVCTCVRIRSQRYNNFRFRAANRVHNKAMGNAKWGFLTMKQP